MLLKKNQRYTLFLFLSLSLSFISAFAGNLGTFGDRIFQFQEKMALKGNTFAEYKLGTLYEFGVSVKPDPIEASNWYRKAAKKDYIPAINRLTYLEIKQNGYDRVKHDPWFKSLISQVSSKEPNALILLGQMNRHGINVDKNLEKAIEYLELASALGHTEVDSEIDEIKREIEANKPVVKTAISVTTKKPDSKLNTPKAKSIKKVVNQPTTTKKVVRKPAKKIVPEESIEEKRKKYEAAMKKLMEENKLMEQQQKWAESDNN